MSTTTKKTPQDQGNEPEITQKDIQNILGQFSFLENNFSPNQALSECFLMNRLKLEPVHTKLRDGLLEGIKTHTLESMKITVEMLQADKVLQKKFNDKFQNAVQTSKAYNDFLAEKVNVTFYKTTLAEIKGSTYHSETMNSLAKHILSITNELD